LNGTLRKEESREPWNIYLFVSTQERRYGFRGQETRLAPGTHELPLSPRLWNRGMSRRLGSSSHERNNNSEKGRKEDARRGGKMEVHH